MQREMREMDERLAKKLGRVCGKCTHATMAKHESGGDMGFVRCALWPNSSYQLFSVAAACAFSPSRFSKFKSTDTPRGQDEISKRRAAACYEPIFDNRRPASEHGEINCAQCDRLGDFDDEHKTGWCMWLHLMRNTRHPARCQAFKPLERERTIKFVWQGLIYGNEK